MRDPGERPPVVAVPPDPRRRLAATTLIAAPLILALAWRVGDLAQPPRHEHAWRDSDGLGIARCFVREGMDLLRPRIVERGDHLGIVGMEFPLVNAAGAVLMKIGGIHDWLARLPCWLALVPLALGAFALARRVLGEVRAAAIAAGCLVLEPLVIIYARKCMPEIPMMAALVWGAALSYDALFRPSLARAVLAGSLLALAAVLKPTGFAVAVPIAIWAYRALRDGRERARAAAAAIVLSAIPVVATVLWFAHARALGTRYGLVFKLEHDWGEWMRLLRSPAHLWVVFGRVLHLYLLWPTVLWMAWRWRITADTARRHRDALAWAAAGLFAVVLFGKHIHAHPYYALPLLVPLTLLVGAFAVRATEAHRRPGLAVAVFVTVFAIGALVRVEQRASDPRTDPYRRFDAARLGAAMARIPSQGLTIATDANSNVVSLVILDRIGWALPPDELTPDAVVELRARGARILIETRFGGWLPDATRAALPPPIWSDDQLRAYALRP